MKQIYGVVLSIVLFLIFPENARAVTISISNYPYSVSSEIFTLTASISGATNATNYLRVDLYKEGTTNYFGETYNGNDWFSGGDGKSYFPVQIQNSSASATLQAQLGNPSSTDYPGPGMYKLRIRRYTASGSQSQNDQQIPGDIQITYVAPTPSPTPEPTSVANNNPSPTPNRTPTPTPVRSSTPKPTNTPETLSNSSISGEILGASVNMDSPAPEESVKDEAVKINFPYFAIFSIVLGVVLVGISFFLAYKKKKANMTSGDDISMLNS